MPFSSFVDWRTPSLIIVNIFLKQHTAKELGYNYEIWVYNSKGIIVEQFL